jgi:hypothetical protein
MSDRKERDRVTPQAAAASAPRDEFDRDLNPDPMAGQNIDAAGAHAERRARTARDVKSLHRSRFNDWSDDDLDQVPIVASGSRLEQGATYLDIGNLQGEEFTATADMTAEEGQSLVLKSSVPYQIWNRLRGVNDVKRTGVAS